jgi:hypothetical protein
MKRAENQPETISVTVYGGVFAKQYRVPDAGTLVPSHAHHYDHLTAVTAGAVEAWAGDTSLGKFEAPAFIKVAAHLKHRFLTLKPGTQFCCLHAVGAAESVDEDALIAERHDLVLED